MGSNFIQSLVGGMQFELEFVEGGALQMGSTDKEGDSDEQPIHEVALSDFYMGKYPVTQAVWKAVMGSENNPSYFRGDLRPVETVSWQDAQEFIKSLNEMTETTRLAGHVYRLPTEAEWEYAARGGKKSKGYKYAGSNKLKEVGWYSENSHEETKAAGLKSPNELDLYDMSGNVWEWCWDWFGSDYYKKCFEEGIVNNPKGQDKGDYRVRRGGSWGNVARRCRASHRHSYGPALRYDDLGFRLVLSPLSVG